MKLQLEEETTKKGGKATKIKIRKWRKTLKLLKF